MSISSVAYNHSQGSGSQTAAVTVSISAGQSVALMAVSTLSNNFVPGTCSDGTANVYTAEASFSDAGDGFQFDVFSSINVGNPSTTLTYTAPANTSYFNIYIVAWVLSATGGTITYGSAAATEVTAGGTNAITSGLLTASGAGSIVLGFAKNTTGSGTLTAGTGMIQDANFGTTGYQEHATVSSNTAVTWTSSNGTDLILLGGISYSCNSTSVAWLT